MTSADVYSIVTDKTNAKLQVFNSEQQAVSDIGNKSLDIFLEPGVYYLRLSSITGLIEYRINQEKLKLNINTGKEYSIKVSSNDITDFNNIEYTVSYSPDDFDIITLCTESAALVTSAGEVEGADIEITQATDGEIKFIVNKDLVTQWSGVVNTIKLKATATTTAGISVSVNMIENGYKISGTVLSAAGLSYSGDPAIDNELNMAWKTIINLKPTVLSESVIASTDVDAANKTFELIGVENGSYILEIKRAGYLTRYVAVTVNNGNVSLPDKSMLAGDLNGDYMIDDSDSGLIAEIFGAQYGDENYNAEYDIFPDGAINDSDIGLISANLGKDITYYNESIDLAGLFNQDQSAPVGLYAVMPTSIANDDGIIMGTTAEMEYRLSSETTYSAVTGTQITGLSPGTYYIRYAARSGYNAGADAVVVVAEYNPYYIPEREEIEDGGKVS